MTDLRYVRRVICLYVTIILMSSCILWTEPVHAASVNRESIISEVRNPSNGIIKYDVTVPPGERIDYSVALTPDKKTGTVDKVSGSWKNRTRKTVRKTIKVNVKYLSNKYKIQASYTKHSSGTETLYRDVDKAESSLKKTVYTTKLSWDFSKLGKGEKKWKYRYKYAPYKKGYRKYLQVFDKNGKLIKNNLKQTVPITKITELIRDMKTR